MRGITLCALLCAVLLSGLACDRGGQVGSMILGYLARGEHRAYQVRLTEGQVYAFRLSAAEGFYVALFNPDGNLIEGRYARGGWAQVTHDCLYSGAYRVKVGAEQQSGNYKLTVQ